MLTGKEAWKTFKIKLPMGITSTVSNFHSNLNSDVIYLRKKNQTTKQTKKIPPGPILIQNFLVLEKTKKHRWTTQSTVNKIPKALSEIPAPFNHKIKQFSILFLLCSVPTIALLTKHFPVNWTLKKYNQACAH